MNIPIKIDQNTGTQVFEKINHNDFDASIDTSKVKVTSNDVTPNYLADKIQAGTDICLYVTDMFGNGDEKLQISAITSNRVKISGDDVLSGYLNDKLQGDTTITPNVETDGDGIETLRIEQLKKNTGLYLQQRRVILIGEHLATDEEIPSDTIDDFIISPFEAVTLFIVAVGFQQGANVDASPIHSIYYGTAFRYNGSVTVNLYRPVVYDTTLNVLTDVSADQITDLTLPISINLNKTFSEIITARQIFTDLLTVDEDTNNNVHRLRFKNKMGISDLILSIDILKSKVYSTYSAEGDIINQATPVYLGGVNCNSMMVTWTNGSPTEPVLVVCRAYEKALLPIDYPLANSSINNPEIDGITDFTIAPTVNNDERSAKIVYFGNSRSYLWIQNLTRCTRYVFQVFQSQLINGQLIFNHSSAANNPRSRSTSI